MRNLRAAATAILLGTAALGAAAAFQPAAAAVSAAVGKPLQEAASLAAAGKYREAMDRAKAAAGAAKTAEEHQKSEQMEQYIAIKSGDASIGGALGAKAKFANDANAGRWKDVIADGEGLAKNGALDAQSSLLVAQAYYQSHDAKGCMNYIRSHGLGGEVALMTLQRCAYDAGDEETQRTALEQLVASTGKAEHWKSLLHLADRAHGLKDHNTLDIFRLKYLTGTIDPADIVLYVTFALQFKSAAEAKAVLDKSLAAKTIPQDDRANRLTKAVNDRLTAYNADFAKNLAAAQKAPKGDDLVAIGEFQIGDGKAKDAIGTIQSGIAKGLNDPSEGQIRLGAAYIAAGQKADAIKALAAVSKTDEKGSLIAHLYSVYARSGASAPAAPAEEKAAKKGKKH
jgi:hypothetical protein